MITKGEIETIEYAKKFAKDLKGGEVIGLIGDLGSGKTTFVKGLAEELRVEENITSPTFVILKPYQARIGDKKIELIHVDAYRIENKEDAESVGLNDYLNQEDEIVVVEWAEKIKEILPPNTIYINFSHKNDTEREINYDK